MTHPSSTPLSQYGSRVPSLPAKPAKPVKASKPTGPIEPSRGEPTVSHSPTHRPTPDTTPPIRTMIVCVPAELPRDALACGQLDQHLGVPGTLTPRFWATAALHLWQRAHLFALRKGRPAYCAGGPVRLLDLAGMRRAAGLAATIRYQLWQRVIHGTRPANPWPVYLQRHLADPGKYPLQAAQADYGRQARVLAVRMYNAANPGGALDLTDLEMVQAGPTAYSHATALSAVAGDALLTTDGTRLAPASGTAADRITFLDHANRHLTALDGQQRLLAVAL